METQGEGLIREVLNNKGEVIAYGGTEIGQLVYDIYFRPGMTAAEVARRHPSVTREAVIRLRRDDILKERAKTRIKVRIKKEPTGEHGPNDLWCGGCERFKFGGLFRACQRTRTDKARRCIECKKNESAATRKRHGVKGAGAAWGTGAGNDMFLEGKQVAMTVSVTALLATYDRRQFIPRSLRCFMAQEYPSDWDVQLVILDDGTDPIKDLVPDHPRINYVRDKARRKTYGAKLNMLCELATGQIMLHWDDDDIYARDRIARQVKPLLDGQFSVSGTSTLYYYRPELKQVFQYIGKKTTWLGGICYVKRLWELRPFDDYLRPGADGRWLRDVPPDFLFDCADPTLIIACIHPNNHSPKTPSGVNWKSIDWAVVAHAIDF